MSAPAPRITREALLEAVKRAYEPPGITQLQALVLGYCEVTHQPLDPWLLDDAAIILRAETLLHEGLLVDEAVRTARHEHATWGTGAPS